MFRAKYLMLALVGVFCLQIYMFEKSRFLASNILQSLPWFNKFKSWTRLCIQVKSRGWNLRLIRKWASKNQFTPEKICLIFYRLISRFYCKIEVSDVTQLMAIVNDKYPKLPKILMGHSCGGLVAIHTALRKQDFFSALVTVQSGAAFVKNNYDSYFSIIFYVLFLQMGNFF